MAEVLSNTSLLARLPRPDEERLSQPFFPARPVRIWYARHPGFASFDPLGSAIGFLAETQTYDRLPVNGGELEGYGAMIVVAARPGLAPFSLEAAAARASNAGRTIPVLYLTSAQPDSSVLPHSAPVTHATYPVPIACLAAFAEAASGNSPARVAA